MSKSHFRHQIVALVMACAFIMPMLTYCSDNNDIEALPVQIQRFLSKYYPEISVSDYSFSHGIYAVTLRNSAYLTFNASMEWTLVDGRGNTLPQMFLFDEMPEPVYQFLESTESLDRVYSAGRTATGTTLHLLDQDVAYDTASGTVTTIP